MPTKESFVKALQAVRKLEAEKHKQTKFNQTVDLIINLRDFDIKRNSLNLVVQLPHKVKDKKIAGFLEKKSPIIDTITKTEFPAFEDKKKLKRLIREYDFFVAGAKLMPAVAATFGRALGPSGKMPSPQLGILMTDNDEALKSLIGKINSSTKVRTKEPCVKVSLGKASGKDEELAENALVVYNETLKSLLKGKENIKSVLIKFTMSKPAKVEL